MRKGISPVLIVVVLILVVVGLLGTAAVFLAAIPAAPAVEVDYDGEFDDGFLASKGAFATSFTEGTDCNITSDILGGAWASCVYETSTALNATASAHMSDHDLYFPFVIDIDGPVEEMEISYEMGAGTSTTGVPEDDIDLMDAKLYTHEDDPTLIYDLEPYIEDIEDLDATLDMKRYRKGDEYVLYMIFHTKTINPAFTDGDDMGRLTIELETEEDQDKAQVTLESG